MNRLVFDDLWFQSLLPEGLPVPSSTIITGPGGSGKPLIGNYIVTKWLLQGGSVIFMSLQYPDHKFINAGLKAVTKLDLDDYQEKIVFIALDVDLDGIELKGKNQIKANVVKPEIWKKSIQSALDILSKEGPGVLLFGSALNLLLFSPTYGDDILDEMKKSLKEGEKYSVLYTTSTSAKGDKIAELDEICDNLLIVRSDRASRKLYLTIEKMKGVKFHPGEVEVPISSDALHDLKEIADQSRKRIAPLVAEL